MKVLRIGRNSYRDWTTFEREYYNNYLTLRLGGSFHNFHYNELGAEELADLTSLMNKFDVILTDPQALSLLMGDKVSRTIGIDRHSHKFYTICSDPWRFEPIIANAIEQHGLRRFGVHSRYFSEYFGKKYSHTGATFSFIPYVVGERHLDLGLTRDVDVLFLGRSEWSPGIRISPIEFLFSSYRVLFRGSASRIRKSESDLIRIFRTIVDYNKSKYSWNTLVYLPGYGIHHVPFRYVESAACGCIPLHSGPTGDLVSYYLPSNGVVTLEGGRGGLLRFLYESQEGFHDAWTERITSNYRFVQKNHCVEARWRQIEADLNFRNAADPRDFYEVKP